MIVVYYSLVGNPTILQLVTKNHVYLTISSSKLLVVTKIVSNYVLLIPNHL